ncbi:MAG: outer membrane lipoprotein-sorting protein [Myxococcota bacterium]
MKSLVSRKVWFALVATSMALLFAGPAAGDGDVLAEVDDAVNRWKTLDYRYSITTQKKNGDMSTLQLRMRMKAGEDNKQMTEIAAPADMKGTKVLILSREQMYIYLPAMKKIRRIASHVNSKAFLGTALSADDMSLTRYSRYYDVVKQKDDGEFVFLKLKAKSDAAPYPRIALKVEKKRWLPVAVKMYNADGKVIKEEKREGYTCTDDFCAPAVMKFKNNATGMRTVLMLTSSQVNEPIDDNIFTKRYLTK